jgi:hypothetical protein
MYRIKNWNQFQHYKDRQPPWIKLYPRLMGDPAYIRLSDRAKVVLFHCWMAAAKVWNPLKEVEPLLPSDPKTLRILLQLDRKLNLNELEDACYLVPVSSDYNNLLDKDDSIVLDKRSPEVEAYKPEKEKEEPKAPTEEHPDDTQAAKQKVLDDLIQKCTEKYAGRWNPMAFFLSEMNKQHRPIECFIDHYERMLRSDPDDPVAYSMSVWKVEAQNVEANLSEAEARKGKGSLISFEDIMKGVTQ